MVEAVEGVLDRNCSYKTLRKTRAIKLTPSQFAKFWRQVSVRDAAQCWPWTGKLAEQGYARWNSYFVHRIAYTDKVGPIPEGFTIDHVRARGCTLRSCCNPAHLEPVTQSENSLRQYADPGRLYSLTWNCGHVREFSVNRCKPCAVKAVARSQAKRADYYREMKRRNKQAERARKLA